MSLTVPLKVPVADFAPLHTSHPELSRSALVRGLLYACAGAETPITPSEFVPPKLAAWTTISVDPVTEILLQHALSLHNASNISALLYAALRNPVIAVRANSYLSLHPVEQKRRAKTLAHRIAGVLDADAPQDEGEVRDAAAAHQRMMSYLTSQIDRTRVAMEAAMREHTAAKAALDAFMVLVSPTSEEPS